MKRGEEGRQEKGGSGEEGGEGKGCVMAVGDGRQCEQHTININSEKAKSFSNKACNFG